MMQMMIGKNTVRNKRGIIMDYSKYLIESKVSPSDRNIILTILLTGKTGGFEMASVNSHIQTMKRGNKFIVKYPKNSASLALELADILDLLDISFTVGLSGGLSIITFEDQKELAKAVVNKR